MLSQNGYPVLATNRTTGSLPRLRMWQIPGTDRHVYLRDGSVGFVLTHLALWFHENIEKIDVGTWDEWGWAVRPVRGQTSGYSNHAAGCAVDLNATLHPRGVSLATFKLVGQVAKIRARLVFYSNVIRWGGDYTQSPKDGMHFEVVKDMAAVEKVARRLSTTPRGKRILDANPGAADVIWDGKPPVAKKPVVKKPAVKKPAAEHLAVDYSYSRPDPDAIKAAGFRGVMRYIPVGKGRDVTRAEVAALHKAGLWVGLVFEETAGRAKEGRTAGHADAVFAEAQADKLGYPADCPITYAVDFDADPAEVVAYFTGIREGATRPVGVYGGFRIIEGITADFYWQTQAWSAGKVSTKANLLQRTTHSNKIKGSVVAEWDENLVVTPGFPQWRP